MNRSVHECSSKRSWSLIGNGLVRHWVLIHPQLRNSICAAVSHINPTKLVGVNGTGWYADITGGVRYALWSTNVRLRADKSKIYGGIVGWIGSARNTKSCWIFFTSSELIMSLPLMNIAIWRRNVEFRGPRSFCTASLFMPTRKHFFSRHARHWFRCVLSTTHWPSVFALHT